MWYVSINNTIADIIADIISDILADIIGDIIANNIADIIATQIFPSDGNYEMAGVKSCLRYRSYTTTNLLFTHCLTPFWTFRSD